MIPSLTTNCRVTRNFKTTSIQKYGRPAGTEHVRNDLCVLVVLFKGQLLKIPTLINNFVIQTAKVLDLFHSMIVE
jgi:hypothetical protein